MKSLTAREIASLAKGRISPIFAGEILIDNVVIDSRQARENSLFIAIKGELNDGHDYVREVVSSKNRVAMVNEEFSADLPNLIRVRNTVLGLGEIAANYRHRFNIPMVAITGSNGKTTVKEMLKSICSCYFGADNVLATNGNFNNHLGLPLTILGLNDQHKVAIFEMGMNHSGELDYLSKMAQPTMAVVNNVMFAHAGHFKSIAEIAAAKGEIYHGLDNKALACVDITNEYSQDWINNDIKAQIFSYGTEATGCFIKSIEDNTATYVTPCGELKISLRVLGQHNYYNALSAIVLAINLGCSLESIKAGLERYTGYKGRLELKNAFNGALIIDDTYNANPDSVKAALNAIQGLPRPYWFIFADLKELGIQELSFHEEVGRYISKSNIDMLITIGDLARHTAYFFDGEKIHFESNQDIVKYCLSNLPKNATLLIKGSNSMRLGEVAEDLSLGRKIF